MIITLEKDGLVYDIKPYFNMAFLFVPITLPLMNMFYTFFVFLIVYYLIDYYALYYLILVISVISFLIGGHLRIMYLGHKGFRPIKNSSEEEVRLFNKIYRNKD